MVDLTKKHLGSQSTDHQASIQRLVAVETAAGQALQPERELEQELAVALAVHCPSGSWVMRQACCLSSHPFPEKAQEEAASRLSAVTFGCAAVACQEAQVVRKQAAIQRDFLRVARVACSLDERSAKFDCIGEIP